MAFLKQAIREQKILEAETDIDNFIQDNEITDDMVIYWMSFDKEVFETETEVREYLNDKFYSVENISDEDSQFSAMLMNTFQLDMDSMREIEIRRGVTARAAELRSMPSEPLEFNQLPTFELSAKDMEICLSEGLPHIIEICRVAEGYHQRYGQIKITKQDLESMERNFKDKVTGVDLAINEDHKKNEAFAWFKDVFRSFDGNTLYAQVAWNAKGTQALSHKEYRYFSPEFQFSYTHPHSGQEYGATLTGGALTNYPFLKMDAIVELGDKNNTNLSRGKKMSEKTILLSEHKSEVLELNSKIHDLEKAQDVAKNTIKTLKEENVELNEKLTAVEKEKEMAEKQAKHEKLFSEGKINKAQLDALNEGADIFDVLELSDKMNTKSKGHNDVDESDIELSEKDKKIYASLGLDIKEDAKYIKGGQ